MNDKTSESPKPHGKTLWDVLGDVFDRWSSTRATFIILLAVVCISLLLWLLAHAAAEPGTEVSLAGGAVKYVKARPTSAAIPDRLHALEAENTSLSAQVLSKDRDATETNLAIEQLRRRLKEAPACQKDKEATESIRQSLSACETRALRAERPPSVYLIRLGAHFSTVAECKDRFSRVFGKITSGRPVKNYENSVGIDNGRYFLFANCSIGSAYVLATGPDHGESEKLARLAASYVLSK